MIIVRWLDSEHTNCAVCDIKTALDLASVLEAAKTEFKVYDLDQPRMQEDFGCAGFLYWLKPEESFSGKKGARQ